MLFTAVIFLNMLLQKSSCLQFVFKTLDISQGNVATNLRSGNDSIFANFLLILTVK